MSFSPEPNPQQSPRDPDEWIAVVIAFSAIAAILFWVLGRSPNEVGLKRSPFLANLFQEEIEPEGNRGKLKEEILEEPDESPLRERVSRREREVRPVPLETEEKEIIQQPLSADLEQPVAREPLLEAEEMPKVVPFTDVPENYWAYGAIAALSDRKIIEGFPDGTFQPDKPITRAEFAAQLPKVFERPENESAINFEDVSQDFWAAPRIDETVQMGFMQGYPGDVFRPNKEITRLEALVTLATGLNLDSPAAPGEILEKYRDREKIDDWAVKQIAAATEAGLTDELPNPKQLNPSQPATRAELASMLYQALKFAEQSEQ
ncbi:S-layer homology domain-containing protein [Lusitaniella coriacea LEGE 07157]|uniref:S-layer homology domain-containing protein n=1 Tax=Lusitaniella coriacea LEGE 07157 TaxID=945747 RepID=A0A8J7DZK7_9CYAN|nr:S-layer homology domain-containing protein [Lusitaniella coriacea]MBE9116591.1 S-layer homology domain-containing protein [Lusitaniella coriacea LEGE 07157]